MYDHYFEACAQGQSEYAIKHFVVGQATTKERRFKQAVIEFQAAKEALQNHCSDIKRLHLKKQRLKKKLAKKRCELKRGIIEIKMEKIDRRIKKLKLAKQAKQDELAILSRLITQYSEALGINPETPVERIKSLLESAEKHHYTNKLMLDTAAQTLHARGGPPPGICLALMQMPTEDREAFKKNLQSVAESIAKLDQIEGLIEFSG